MGLILITKKVELKSKFSKNCKYLIFKINNILQNKLVTKLYFHCQTTMMLNLLKENIQIVWLHKRPKYYEPHLRHYPGRDNHFGLESNSGM
jgi:hypothetical protein